MILLVDTDILIDVALDRMPYAESSSALLDRLEQTPGTAFVAWGLNRHCSKESMEQGFVHAGRAVPFSLVLPLSTMWRLTVREQLAMVNYSEWA